MQPLYIPQLEDERGQRAYPAASMRSTPRCDAGPGGSNVHYNPRRDTHGGGKLTKGSASPGKTSQRKEGKSIPRQGGHTVLCIYCNMSYFVWLYAIISRVLRSD